MRNASVRCFVPNCRFMGDGRTLHTIPSDPKRRSLWLEAIGLSKIVQKDPRICSHHFKKEDYSNFWQHMEYPKFHPRLFLKQTAVPSAFLNLEPGPDIYEPFMSFQVDDQVPQSVKTRVERQEEPKTQVEKQETKTRVEREEPDFKTQVEKQEPTRAVLLLPPNQGNVCFQVEGRQVVARLNTRDEIGEPVAKVARLQGAESENADGATVKSAEVGVKEPSHVRTDKGAVIIKVKKQPARVPREIEEVSDHIQTEEREQPVYNQTSEPAIKIVSLCAESEHVSQSATVVVSVNTQTATPQMTTKETQFKPEHKSQGTNFKPQMKSVGTTSSPLTVEGRSVATQAYSQREADLYEEVKQMRRHVKRLECEAARWKKRALK